MAGSAKQHDPGSRAAWRPLCLQRLYSQGVLTASLCTSGVTEADVPSRPSVGQSCCLTTKLALLQGTHVAWSCQIAPCVLHWLCSWMFILPKRSFMRGSPHLSRVGCGLRLVQWCMQDIDAAYMLGSSADLDAGLSALLEVPDFDSHSSPSDHDLFSGGMMGMPAAGVHICLAPTYPHAALHGPLPDPLRAAVACQSTFSGAWLGVLHQAGALCYRHAAAAHGKRV